MSKSTAATRGGGAMAGWLSALIACCGRMLWGVNVVMGF